MSRSCKQNGTHAAELLLFFNVNLLLLWSKSLLWNFKYKDITLKNHQLPKKWSPKSQKQYNEVLGFLRRSVISLLWKALFRWSPLDLQECLGQVNATFKCWLLLRPYNFAHQNYCVSHMQQNRNFSALGTNVSPIIVYWNKTFLPAYSLSVLS